MFTKGNSRASDMAAKKHGINTTRDDENETKLKNARAFKEYHEINRDLGLEKFHFRGDYGLNGQYRGSLFADPEEYKNNKKNVNKERKEKKLTLCHGCRIKFVDGEWIEHIKCDEHQKYLKHPRFEIFRNYVNKINKSLKENRNNKKPIGNNGRNNNGPSAKTIKIVQNNTNKIKYTKRGLKMYQKGMKQCGDEAKRND